MRIEYGNNSDDKIRTISALGITAFDSESKYLNYLTYSDKYKYGKIADIRTAKIGSCLNYNLKVTLKYVKGSYAEKYFPEEITGVSIVNIYLAPEFNLVIIECFETTYKVTASEIYDMVIS